jgi:hypothetical protein
MVRDRRLILIPLAALLIFMVFYFIYQGQRQSASQAGVKLIDYSWFESWPSK